MLAWYFKIYLKNRLKGIVVRPFLPGNSCTLAPEMFPWIISLMMPSILSRSPFYSSAGFPGLTLTFFLPYFLLLCSLFQLSQDFLNFVFNSSCEFFMSALMMLISKNSYLSSKYSFYIGSKAIVSWNIFLIL